MSETSNNSAIPKPKISKLAMGSLIFFVSAFILTGISLTVWPMMYAVVLCLILIAVSIICGIAALVTIALSKKKLAGIKIAWLSIVASVALHFIMGPAIDISKRIAIAYTRCGSNLSNLGKFISLYSKDNNGKYPTADKWCDLLVEYDDVDNSSFVCDNALRQGDTSSCHFAINPKCGPNSPDDTVLLFETKGGWSQYGGSELITTKNHKGKGCNILFNGRYVTFVKTENLGKLKWGDEQKNK